MQASSLWLVKHEVSLLLCRSSHASYDFRFVNCMRDHTASTEFGNFAAAESQFLQQFVVVLANCRGTTCGNLGNVVHGQGAAHGQLYMLPGAFDRYDDVVLQQLWIFDHL